MPSTNQQHLKEEEGQKSRLALKARMC